MNLFDVLLTQPITNVLIAYLKILDIAHIPGAFGFAIIFLTVTIRMFLWPMTNAQLKSSQKMAALKPHLEKIKADFGHDKIRHQQEMTRLYKEHGVNPLSGCLPLLLQIPIFIALYNVLLNIINFDKSDFLAHVNDKLYFGFLHLDKVPGTSFLGFDLSTKPSQWGQVGILVLLIPAATGLFQFVQSKMLVPLTVKKK